MTTHHAPTREKRKNFYVGEETEALLEACQTLLPTIDGQPTSRSAIVRLAIRELHAKLLEPAAEG